MLCPCPLGLAVSRCRRWWRSRSLTWSLRCRGDEYLATARGQRAGAVGAVGGAVVPPDPQLGASADVVGNGGVIVSGGTGAPADPGDVHLAVTGSGHRMRNVVKSTQRRVAAGTQAPSAGRGPVRGHAARRPRPRTGREPCRRGRRRPAAA